VKRFATFLFVAAVAAWAGWIAREWSSGPTNSSDAGNPDKPHEGLSVEQGVVKLEPELLERLGIVTSPLAAAEWRDGADAIGVVLDPAPFIGLTQEMDAATAALQAARVELDRAASLFRSGQNVARKLVDTAESQVRTEDLKLEALRTKLRLDWGAICEGLDGPALHKLVEKLVLRKSALIRVEICDAQVTLGPVTGAEVVAFGNPIAVERLAPAPAVNERTRALGFLLLGDTAAQALPNGASVTARIVFPGSPQPGVEVPRECVVRQGFQAWVYVEDEPRQFLRVPVTLNHRTPPGWFVPSGEKLKAGERVVTRGAAALLSAELVSAGFGSVEEE
jgi:hypothetical protein